MQRMNKRNKFAVKTEKDFERRRNNREEKRVKEDLPNMLFSFKDFDNSQIPPGQSYGNWEEHELLAYMLEKFGEICNCNVVEAQQQGWLKIYGEFPPVSDFRPPMHIVEEVKWAVIMRIKGQKGRVAGHIIGNVFYVVFLDCEHKFYKTALKNT